MSNMLSHPMTQRPVVRHTRRPFVSSRAAPCTCHHAEPSAPDSGPSRAQSASRRGMLLSSAAAAALISASRPASAIGFKKELKRRGARATEDYSEGPSGLKTLELAEGSGTAVKEGDLVTVHFDTIFKGIDVASSRSARLLGGNRTIAEPLSFTAGKKVGFIEKTAGESAGGLFSGQSGPKPPPALSVAVLGMKPGGKRSVLVPSELAYKHQGYLEIPADADIELRVELLSIGGS